MRTISVAFLFLLAATFALAQNSDMAMAPKSKGDSGVEDQIKKLEQDWGHAVAKRSAASLDQFEADDIISTDPSGRVTDKAQDKQDVSSGDLKFDSIEPSEMKVRVFGTVAVVTGTTTIKGTFKEQDISGAYRFTDTWAKRNGKWQCVAAHASKIQQ